MPRFLTTPISGSQCIGDSLPIINNNYEALDTVVYALSTNTIAVSSTATVTPVLLPSTTSFPWTKTLAANVNDGSITTAKLENSSVTTVKLSSGAVTNAKIAFDGGAFSFRNKIINGDMRIDQRNAGAASTNTLGSFTYSVDRWTIGSDGAATTSQRITDPTTGLHSLRVTGAVGNTAISFNQRIESQNTVDLVNNIVNLSFDAFASTSMSVQWQVSYPTVQDNFTSWTAFATGTVNVTTTRTTFNTGPITLDTNANKGLLVRFVVSNHTAGRTINLTNVQLEEGSTATPFEHRPIGTELALCQRYYEKLNGVVQSNGPTTGCVTWAYKATKRAIPSVNNTYTANPQSVVSNGLDGYTSAGSSVGVVGDGSTSSAEL